MSKKEQLLLAWQAPEYRHYKKNAGWYLTFAFLILLLIIYLFLNRDYFGAFTLVAMSVIIFLFSRHKPMDITYALTTKGVHMHEAFIDYDNIKSFWLHKIEEHTYITIETTAYLNHLIVLELGETNPEEVVDILSQYAPEDKDKADSWLQEIMHKINF